MNIIKNLIKYIGLTALFRKKLPLFMVFLCIFGSVICISMIIFSENISAKQSNVLYAVYVNVALMAILVSLVYKDFLRLWKSRRSHGSILQMKLISTFSALAVVPSFVMVFFSAIFFHKGIESWFNARNNAVLQESLNVAEAYLNEHTKIIKDDGLGLARAIEINIASLTPSQLSNDEIVSTTISELMDDLFAMKNIDGGILFGKDDKILARSKYSLSLNFALISSNDFNEALISGVKVINCFPDNKIMALMRVSVVTRAPFFLLIERKIDEGISNYVKKTKSAYSEYHELAEYRTHLEIAFILMFVILGVLLLLAAISTAIKFAGQLIGPISNLVDTAEKIRDGNLSVRADNNRFVKELDLLTNTFNDMISQIQVQQTELKNKNAELDKQFQFIQNVLSGVSSGVISLNNRCRINTFNGKAEEILNKKLTHGTLFFDIFPKTVQMFERLRSLASIEDQIEFVRGLEHRTFLVKLATLKENNVPFGYIVTFDDVTNLISAQRKAAWADVARRVAHEIKNPLTPIQLAAERIFRKYSKQITADEETFKKLTDTIVKQVGDIRRLTDEFSFFARLPEPKLKKCILADIAKQAVFFVQNAYQDINIELNNNLENTDIIGDERLIHQAIMNVLQNAINAMKSTKNEDKHDKIIVTFGDTDGFVDIYIDDNGPGLPKSERNMLTEPYFTLMPKGTGLGLAIVKKIVQDHNGRITLGDNEMCGARIILSFPIDQKTE